MVGHKVSMIREWVCFIGEIMVANFLTARFPSAQVTMLQALLGLTMLFVTSQICIPIQPVPITMQTVGVMLVGLVLPYRPAMLASAGFIVLGAAGVPLWAGWKCGLSVLAGPTGGYLIGFVLAIHVMTRLREYLSFTGWYLAGICMVGQVCIYACGIAWLSVHTGSIQQALQFGLWPFIVPGVIKSAILSFSVRSLMRA